MKNMLSFDRIIASIGVLLCAGTLAWAQEYSHVRIVRLSFEEGTVNLTRPNVGATSEASVNTPIEEGYVLSTSQDSFAEVEFENTSTARVGQLSELHFNQLALDSNGTKLNGMELRQGYATFTILPENGDQYNVQAGAVTIVPFSDKTVQYRVDLDSAGARVEVFKGTVEVSGSFGQRRVGKNDVLEFDSAADEPLQVSHGITKDAWDEWVEQREDEAQMARRKGPPGNYTSEVNSYLYGWNDLYYYGAWNNIPGYGMCWFPSVGYGWVPYSVGQWVWYPGFGYTWVSFEPWGWLPFHYGGWFFDPGFGWAWAPGGFNTWSPALVNWYQGQTWVAWSPRPLRPRPGGGMTASQACPGQTCTTVVSTEAFRSGRPVQGHRVAGVDVTDSFAVGRPSIAPMEAVATTGSPAIATGSGRTPAGGMTRPGSAPSGASPRSTFEGAGTATEGRVVFDSKEGRFVNGREGAPAQPAASEAAPTSTTNAEAPHGRAPAEAPSARPAAPVAAPASGVGTIPEGSHHASPRTGVESPRSQGSFDRMVGSFGDSSSSGRSSSGSSSSRSSSGSGGWSSGGSRSSGGSSSSSGASRSSGGFGGGGGGGGGARTSAPSGGGHSGGGTPHR
jgi:uncharacterized protein DUF6600/FecR-like protein